MCLVLICDKDTGAFIYDEEVNFINLENEFICLSVYMYIYIYIYVYSVILLKRLWLLLRVSRGCDLQATETASIHCLLFLRSLTSWFAGVGRLIAIVLVWLVFEMRYLFRCLHFETISDLLLRRIFRRAFMMQSFSSGQRLHLFLSACVGRGPFHDRPFYAERSVFRF